MITTYSSAHCWQPSTRGGKWEGIHTVQCITRDTDTTKQLQHKTPLMESYASDTFTVVYCRRMLTWKANSMLQEGHTRVIGNRNAYLYKTTLVYIDYLGV